MPRNAPADRTDCMTCGGKLPSRHDRESARGRPRLYCTTVCKERARLLNDLERRAAALEDEGRHDAAHRVRVRLAVSRHHWSKPFLR